MVQHFSGSLPDPSSHILPLLDHEASNGICVPTTPKLSSPVPISLPASSLMYPFIYFHLHVLTTQYIQMCPGSSTPPTSL